MVKRPPKPEDRAAQPRHKAKKETSFAQACEAARQLTELGIDINADRKDEYFTADDRSFAILRAANVENALENALVQRLIVHKGQRRALFKSDGPLGSFSNKITIGYALGIFGPITKNNLDVIRNIRNAFAHAKRDITFDTKEISDLCSFLTVPEVKHNSEADPLPGQPKPPGKSPMRNAYYLTTFVVEISLIMFVAKSLRKEIAGRGQTTDVPVTVRLLLFDESLP